MAYNEFNTTIKINGCFIVRNICSDPRRTIRIFQYPINNGATRDILKIPGVSESDIRASLLKGELNQRLFYKEIMVECSDIDLLQFNIDQKAFLQAGGIVNGLDSSGTIPFLLKQNMQLIGTIDGINKIFQVPSPDKFIEGIFVGNEFHIQILHNNIALTKDQDFTISESGGAGAGFDTITIISFTPAINSLLSANYVVKL